MKIIFPSLIFFISFVVPKSKITQSIENSLSKKLPVWIAYGKMLPPDSIKDFVKVYIQTKGYQTMNNKEAEASVIAEMTTAYMDIINNKISGGDIGKEMRDKYEPVCTVLWMNIFSNQSHPDTYNIDSIYWRTNVLPAKDSGTSIQRFYPYKKEGESVYFVLRSFLDSVIVSGYLNKNG